MRNNENEKYVKAGVTAFVVLLVGLLCFFILNNIKGVEGALKNVMGILGPFVYGIAVAYLVTPLCNKLEKLFQGWFPEKYKKRASGLAITISLLVALAVILAILLMLVPQLVTSIRGLVVELPGQVRTLRAQLDEWLESEPEWLSWWESAFGGVSNQIDSWVENELPATAQAILSGAISRAAGVVTVLKNLILGMFVAIYLLARRGQLAFQARLLARGIFKPRWADWIEREVHYADRMFNGFFMGKLLDSAIVGLICFAGCLIMGFESPVLIAVIIGVTNIIPFFGPFIGAIPCALLLLLENPMHSLMFVIFIVILQQVDGNLIGPRVLGNTTGLSGMWVMFAILLFGGLWGVSGMLIGVPLMAVIYDVIRQLTYLGVRKNAQGELINEYNETYHAQAQNPPNPPKRPFWRRWKRK